MCSLVFYWLASLNQSKKQLEQLPVGGATALFQLYLMSK